MTMNTIVRSVPAGEFKAHCLALLDEVAATGKALTVTKRGKPVARLVPVEVPRPLLGSILRQKDLVSPVNIKWDAER
jgi:prevent-host-death family protein